MKIDCGTPLFYRVLKVVKLGCPQSWGVLKVGVSSKLGCPQSWGVLKVGVSSKLGCPQSWGVLKAGVSSKLGCPQSWGVLKVGVSSKLEGSLKGIGQRYQVRKIFVYKSVLFGLDERRHGHFLIQAFTQLREFVCEQVYVNVLCQLESQLGGVLGAVIIGIVKSVGFQ